MVYSDDRPTSHVHWGCEINGNLMNLITSILSIFISNSPSMLCIIAVLLVINAFHLLLGEIKVHADLNYLYSYALPMLMPVLLLDLNQ